MCRLIFIKIFKYMYCKLHKINSVKILKRIACFCIAVIIILFHLIFTKFLLTVIPFLWKIPLELVYVECLATIDDPNHWIFCLELYVLKNTSLKKIPVSFRPPLWWFWPPNRRQTLKSRPLCKRKFERSIYL